MWTTKLDISSVVTQVTVFIFNYLRQSNEQKIISLYVYRTQDDIIISLKLSKFNILRQSSLTSLFLILFLLVIPITVRGFFISAVCSLLFIWVFRTQLVVDQYLLIHSFQHNHFCFLLFSVKMYFVSYDKCTFNSIIYSASLVPGSCIFVPRYLTV